MSLSSNAFILLFFVFCDKPCIIPGASSRTFLAIFLKVLFLPTFFANLTTLPNALLKPLPRCLGCCLFPLGAVLCLVARLYLATNVLPSGNLTFFGFARLPLQFYLSSFFM